MSHYQQKFRKESNQDKEAVDNDLSEASSDPNIDWIIVYFHKPLYVLPGSHDPQDELREIYASHFHQI